MLKLIIIIIKIFYFVIIYIISFSVIFLKKKRKRKTCYKTFLHWKTSLPATKPPTNHPSTNAYTKEKYTKKKNKLKPHFFFILAFEMSAIISMFTIAKIYIKTYKYIYIYIKCTHFKWRQNIFQMLALYTYKRINKITVKYNSYVYYNWVMVYIILLYIFTMQLLFLLRCYKLYMRPYICV